jgi:hypothetical protein
MKLFWIGSAVGFILGAGATVIYLSLATLFSANGKAALAQSSPVPLQQNGETAAGEPAREKTRSVGA